MLKAKRKNCPYMSGKKDSKAVDFKNKELRKFINDTGHIVANRITTLSPFWQKRVAREIKYARYLAILPYTDSH